MTDSNSTSYDKLKYEIITKLYLHIIIIMYCDSSTHNENRLKINILAIEVLKLQLKNASFFVVVSHPQSHFENSQTTLARKFHYFSRCLDLSFLVSSNFSAALSNLIPTEEETKVGHHKAVFEVVLI